MLFFFFKNPPGIIFGGGRGIIVSLISYLSFANSSLFPYFSFVLDRISFIVCVVVFVVHALWCFVEDFCLFLLMVNLSLV